mmetsp:Transcript_92112/g.256414  ORF Transcript_92112/g.256414 Transcript_92112/m.256414 type:complete len:125 (+) Transcript_92112:1-375(+)
MPHGVASELAKLDPVNLVGAVCHWLRLLLRRTPWVEALRRMSHDELRGLVPKLGLATPTSVNRCRLVAKILNRASHDRAFSDELIRELATEGAAGCGAQGLDLDELEECPRSVKLKVSEVRNVS